MRKLVVTEFMSLDGVDRGARRRGRLPARGVDDARSGPTTSASFKSEELESAERLAARPGDVRGLRRGLAGAGR